MVPLYARAGADKRTASSAIAVTAVLFCNNTIGPLNALKTARSFVREDWKKGKRKKRKANKNFIFG